MLNESLKIFFLVSFFLLAGGPPAAAFDASLPPLEESRAFKEYAQRPSTELSKLIYLIDRFKEAEIEILYDGIHFRPAFAANVAKWFLSRQYRGQTSEAWILEWCHTTVPAGNLIWVKDRAGNHKAARQVLMEELEKLEKACREDSVCEETG